MKPRLYLETTIISYLTARPSRDMVTSAHQQITREWWAQRRRYFDLVTSELVIQEAAAGDPDAAQTRLELLRDIPIVQTETQAVSRLASHLLKRCALPRKAAQDAVHIAVAVTSGVAYLLTWNCKHIANAVMRSKIDEACAELGYAATVISTPLELMEPPE